MNRKQGAYLAPMLTKAGGAILLLLAGLIFSPLAAAAPPKEPQVDTAEVIRRGDLVEHIDGFRDDNPDLAAIIKATATPPDDSGRWFVTFFTGDTCPHCKRLEEDLAREPLASFIDPKYAHVNRYRQEDGSQAWRKRKEQFSINHIPTIIIQTPTDGSMGEPGLVVYRSEGYSGDSAKLAVAMRAAVQAYVVKHSRQNQPRGFEQAGQVGADPPFAVPSIQPAPAPGVPATPFFPAIPPPAQPTAPPAVGPPAQPQLDLGPLLNQLLQFFGATTAGLWLLKIYKIIAAIRGWPQLPGDTTSEAAPSTSSAQK